jgi:hypothetical protein
MNLRTLYLKTSFSFLGRHSLGGRQLYDQFRSISDDCLLCHMVLPDEEVIKYSSSIYTRTRIKDDILPVSLVKSFDPNLIYVEGGLFTESNLDISQENEPSHTSFKEGQWKIPRGFVEELVANGAVIIIADVGWNQWSHQKSSYRTASDFFRVWAYYGREDKDRPVYGVDRTTNQREFICKPEKMLVSDWLRPIYDGISEILVVGPIKLIGIGNEPLASGNRGSTGTLQDDLWVEEQDYCVFASVVNWGFGYIVFIAGDVSWDSIIKRCSDNLKWLTTIGTFLVEEVKREKMRVGSHLKSPYVLFLSHRSVDDAIVSQIAREIKQRGIGIWLDKEKLIPSDSLIEEINRGLEQMTHFVLFWSEACVDSPWVKKELNAATAKLIESRLPILLVRLDRASVPAILADLYRIEGSGMSAAEIGNAIADAIEHLAKRNQA